MLNWKLSCSIPVIATCVGLAAPSSTALAQGQTSVTDDASQDIIVTAQKRQESSRNVPISITAVSGERLETLDIKDVRDLGLITPGYQAQSPGNPTVSSVAIRGGGQRDIAIHQEGAVATFLDGAYISFSPAVAMPVYDVERIEVLKGPQSTLFGRNATGGLISIISRRPRQIFDATFSLGYGSYNEIKAEGAVGGPLSSTISARASFSYTKSDGFVRNASGPALNANESLSGRVQVLFEPTDDLELLVSAHTWQFFDSPGAGLAPTPFIVDATGTTRKPDSAAEYAAFCAGLNPFAPPPSGAWQNGSCFASQPDRLSGSFGTGVRAKEDWQGIIGTLNWNVGNDVTLTAVTDYQHMSMSYLSNISATPVPIFQFGITGKGSKQFSQEIRLGGSSAALTWVGGLYFLSIDHDVGGLVDLYNHPAFGIRLPSAITQKTKSYAVFGQVDWGFAPDLTLSIGGRLFNDNKKYDNVSTCTSNPLAPPGLCTFLGAVVFPGALAFNRSYTGEIDRTNWSGRASLRYQPGRDTMVYGSITRGVKGGGFNGGAAEFYPLSAVEFGEEVLTSYELGTKLGLLDNKVTFEGALFYYDYKGYQTYSPSSNGGLRVFNVDATVKGAEFALTVRPVAGLSLRATGAYLDTKQKDVPLPSGGTADFQIPDAPHFTANGEIRYAFPITGDDEAALQVTATYAGERSIAAIDFPEQRIGSYYKLDARASYELPGGHLTLAAFANNFTNQTILTNRVDFTTVTGNGVDTFDRPRWFGGSVTYKY